MWLRSLALSLAVVVAAGCGAAREIGPEERRAVEATLNAYAEAMAAAYESGDAASVAPFATGREQERLAISIHELATEGRALRPELRSLAIETMARAGNVSVVANTVEVWDLRVVTVGGEQLVSESLAQENRLSYTLVREEGEWRVLSRLLRTSTEGS